MFLLLTLLLVIGFGFFGNTYILLQYLNFIPVYGEGPTGDWFYFCFINAFEHLLLSSIVHYHIRLQTVTSACKKHCSAPYLNSLLLVRNVVL